MPDTATVQTITDLGQRVKAKHPEYADLPDDEVGRRVKAKFPGEYGDFADNSPTPAAPPEQENWWLHQLKGVGRFIEGSTPSKAWLDRLLTHDPVGALKEIPKTAAAMANEQVRYPIPLVGPSIHAAADAFSKGEYGEGAMHFLTALAGAKAAGFELPGIPEAAAQAGADVATAATAVKGAVVGGAKASYRNPILKYTILEPVRMGIGAFKGAKEALAARRAQGIPDPVAAAGEDTGILDEIAQGQAGKKFSSLDADGQASVRLLAQRMQGTAEPPPAATPQSKAAAVDAEVAQHVSQPAKPTQSPYDQMTAELAARRLNQKPLGRAAAQPPPAAEPPATVPRGTLNVEGAEKPLGTQDISDLVSAARRVLGKKAAPADQPAPASPLPAPVAPMPAALQGNPAAAAAASALAEKLMPGRGTGVRTIAPDPTAPVPRGVVDQAHYVRNVNADLISKFLDQNKETFGELDITKLPTDSPAWDLLAQKTGAEVPGGAEARAKLATEINSRLKPATIGEQFQKKTLQDAAASSILKPNGPTATGQSEPVSTPSGPSSPAGYGSDTIIRIPGEDRNFQARYAVRDLSDVHASHNPYNLEPNPAYQFTNDRNYSDPRNAERVINQVSKFDPEYLTSESPDAVNGPPIIDTNGNVLGGNSRVITLARVYRDKPEGGQAYLASLNGKLQQYGIDPTAVKGMKNPVLVREISHVLEPGQAQQAVTSFNRVGTGSLTPAERAISDSRRISQGSIDLIAGKIEAQGEGGTLAAALEGGHGRQVIQSLIDDGTIPLAEKSRYLSKGLITSEGKDRVSQIFLGRLFKNPSDLESLPASIKNTMERVVAPVTKLPRGEWDITPHLSEAMDLLSEARQRGIKNLDDLRSQTGMFGNESYSPEAFSIAKTLQSGGLKAQKAFNSYASDAAYGHEGSMLGNAPTPAEAFAHAFGK